MIITDKEHIKDQLRMTPALKIAADFLRQTDLPRLAEGRTEIDGDRVFALAQRYETSTAGAPLFEFHRKYIDIQIVVSGVEVIGWMPADRMEVTEPYDETRDICFGKAPAGAWTPVRLEAGQLAVFWPSDAHAPKQSAGASSAVMKIVVKVSV